VLSARIVALRRSLWVEDDVGNLAGFPLVGEEGTEFESGTADIEVGEPDGYKCGIPAPLMRVEFRGGFCPTAHVVLAQDIVRSRD
jgi:hypothetical protein